MVRSLRFYLGATQPYVQLSWSEDWSGSANRDAETQAQTLEQRRRNAQFVKNQEARRGKADPDTKIRTKIVQKSPISPFWLGKNLRYSPSYPPLPHLVT